MGKVRTDDRAAEQDSGRRGDVEYVDEETAQRLLDKHMSRWSTLLERLK